MKSALISLVLIFTNALAAQVDTTIYYPMHIGDKWEYRTEGSGYHLVEITADTLMPNGHVYYIFSGGVYAWRYQRNVNNYWVYYYNPPDSTEYLLFDFQAPDKTLWDVPFDLFWGIFETNVDDNNILNLPLENKIFVHASIDSTQGIPDTLWGYLVDVYPTRITKAFGITSYSYGIQFLTGAIINGFGYGTLTAIGDSKTRYIKSFNLFQNYPNPFNPATTIKYSIPQKTSIKITVYNTSGKKVKSLYNGIIQGGEHSVIFDGAELPSGVYYVQLVAETFKKSIKTLLIK